MYHERMRSMNICQSEFPLSSFPRRKSILVFIRVPFISVLNPSRTALAWDGVQDKGLNRGFRSERLMMNFVSCLNQNYSCGFTIEKLHNGTIVVSKRGTSKEM